MSEKFTSKIYIELKKKKKTQHSMVKTKQIIYLKTGNEKYKVFQGIYTNIKQILKGDQHH